MFGKRALSKAGPPNVSSDHNHTQFLLMVVIVLGLSFLMVWGFVGGYIQKIMHDMGMHFSVLFIVILAFGFLKGFFDSAEIGNYFNKIKKVGGDSDGLKKLVQLDGKLTQRDVDMILANVEDWLDYKEDILSRAGRYAIIFGFLGTMIGLIDYGLEAFVGIEITTDSILLGLPKFFAGAKMAIQTTVAGILVSVIISTVTAHVKYSSNKLLARLRRALEAGREDR